MTESENKQRIRRIALLVALSCVLQISESLIPHPVPGLRLGLANMLTLVALILLDFRTALEIAVFRTLLSSLIIGTFMSPTFILSLSGAVVSTFAMGLSYRFSRLRFRFGPSIFGVSIVGALTHNMTQLYLAYLILVRHGGVFVFLPWLCFGSVFTGWVSGAVAGGVCRGIGSMGTQENLRTPLQENLGTPLRKFSGPDIRHYLPGNSFLHRMPPASKLVLLILLALLILLFDAFCFYAALFLFLAGLVACSGIPPASLLSKIRKYRFLVLLGFFLPLFFNSGTRVLFSVFHLDITREGVTAGGVFAFRILFLITLSALTTMTTSPREITQGLEKLLRPLRHLGISEKRIASILSLSWGAIPFIWETARETILAAELKKAKNLRMMIPLLSGLITAFYLESGPESRVWKDACPDREETKE